VRSLVEANLRFVIHYAKKFANPNVSIMDSSNEGNLALIYAAQRFDPNRDTRFVTYAGWWLRQAMLLALSKNTAFALSPKTLGQIYRMERAVAKPVQGPAAPPLHGGGGRGAGPAGERG